MKQLANMQPGKHRVQAGEFGFVKFPLAVSDLQILNRTYGLIENFSTTFGEFALSKSI